MADNLLSMGSYKLTALTVKSKAVDIYAAVYGSRQWVVYKDGPNFAMGAYKLTALVVNRKNPDIFAAVYGGRQWLVYRDAPSFGMASFKSSALVVNRANPDLTGVIYGGRYTFLIRPPTAALFGGRYAFLINQVEVGPAVYIPQTFSFAIQRADWPGVEDVYSTSSAVQVRQMVVVKNTDNAFVWSMSRVLQAAQLAVVARPVTTPQSITRVAEAVMLALQSRPIHTISIERVPQVAQLTLISLDRVPVPTSGRFYAQYALTTLLARPVSGMPQSPSKVATTAELVLQKRIDTFPRSMETVRQSVQLVLVPNTLPLARGPEFARQAFMLALQGNPMPAMNDPAYRSAGHVAEVPQLVLHKQGDLPKHVGKEQAIQLAHMTLQRNPIVTQFGVQHTRLAVEMVLQRNPMPKPGSMSGANLPSVRLQAIIKADGYPLASGIQSTTRLAQVGLQWLVDATYRKPGDIVSGSKYTFYNTLHITTLMSRRERLPISRTRVPSLAVLTTMHASYDSPEDVFNDGLFVTLAGEQILALEQYPTPWEPTSNVEASGIFEALLTIDDSFPDKSYSRSDLQATSIVEALACEDNSFPDKDLPQSKVIADVIAESLATVDDSFPNPNIPQAQLQATLTVESVAALADDYPAKDMVLSAVVVTSLVESVALRDQFPDKDVPQSIMEVTGVAEVVMRFDDTMTEMPQYQGRRKPTIFVQIVY